MISIRIKFSKTICISVFLSCFFSFTRELCLLYASIAVHEFAHLLAAKLCRVKCKEINLDIFGMSLLCSPCDTPSKSVIILSAGPLVSFFMWYICHLSGKYAYTDFFAFSNLCVLCVNLFPISPLDGGRIIKTVLQSRCGIIQGTKMSKKFSRYIRISFIVLWIMSIVFKFFNPSALMFIIFLAISEKKEKDTVLYEKNCVFSGHISKRRKPKYITFDSKSELLAIAEKISYSYFLVAVIFKDERYIGEIDERELLYAIRKRGSLCSLEELFVSRR